MSTFDPTKPEEWLHVGRLWKNTYGDMPSNHELMMAMMSGIFPPAPGAPDADDAPPTSHTASQSGSSHWERHGQGDAYSRHAHPRGDAQVRGASSRNGYGGQHRGFDDGDGRRHSQNAHDDRGPSESFTIPTTR
jgi:hypothetical protein